MVSRLGCLLLAFFVAGCQALAPLELADGGPLAEILWERGQAAMRQGRPAQAVAFYEQSLAKAPDHTRNHLSLAAAYLEMGEPAKACAGLAKYVAAHPEEIVVRAQYAELLVRLHRDRAARREFEECIAGAQELGKAGMRHLIHCHSRLMELAENQADTYAEHLHRGIGLYLLALESSHLAEAEAVLPSEGLYCKAAGELTLALEERPDEARPSWYLYEVWSHLGQRPPARRCLQEAGAAAPFSYLTPSEQRGLDVAGHAQDLAMLHK
jgi:tetratricopeptide (TPR) repeat protein